MSSDHPGRGCRDSDDEHHVQLAHSQKRSLHENEDEDGTLMKRLKPDIFDIKTTTKEHMQEITQRNQSMSPLLRLPAELRSQILDPMFPTHIHVWYMIPVHRSSQAGGIKYHQHGVGGLHHYVFYNPSPAYSLEHSLSSAEFRSARRLTNEYEYTKEYSIGSDGEAHFTLKPNTSLLKKLTPVWQVCRQLYLETTPILYSRPVFSFENPWACSKFRDQLHPEQKSAVTELAVTVGVYWQNLEVTIPLFDGFKGLKVVYICHIGIKTVKEEIELLMEDLAKRGIEVRLY